jgi:hypothetical protein
MSDFLVLEQMNDNCGKTVHTKTMDKDRVSKRRTFISMHTNVLLSSCYGFQFLWHDKASFVKYNIDKNKKIVTWKQKLSWGFSSKVFF